MIEIYKSEHNQLSKGTYQDENIWISLTSPTNNELDEVIKNVNVEKDFLYAALDPEEVSRIESEDNQVLIIVNAAIEEDSDDNKLNYNTIPVGIILLDNAIITVTLEKLNSIEKFKNINLKITNVAKKTRFTLQIIYQIAVQYLFVLRRIDRYTERIESYLAENLENDYLIQLLALEKNLVYFTTSLKGNENVLKKIMRTNIITKYEEDNELLEDALIEIQQASEMASINSTIIRSIRDTFASLISNNLNIVMKILASVTIIMTIPMIVYSFFGMNTNFTKFTQSIWSSIIILISTIIVSIVVFFIMKKKKML